MIARHGVVLSLAFGGVMLPALFGTSGSHDSPQVIDSAWLAQVQPLAQAAPCAGCAETVAAVSDSPQVEGAAVVAVPEFAEPWGTMELREGDTLFDLAAWFGIAAEDIAAANGLTLDDYLLVGGTVVIPIPRSQFITPPVPVVYVPELEPEPIATVVASAPTVTPTPAHTVFAGSTNDVITAICSLPWPCDKMVRIAMCESGLNPNAYNRTGYYGLFQLDFAPAGWNDPWVNAQAAYYRRYLPALASGDGTSPWPHCRYY